MKKFIFFFFVLLGLGSITAQLPDNHSSFSFGGIKQFNENDSLKILAVMVEFQPDLYDATIGTGKFGSHYTQEYGDTIIDPLPHDKQYFEDHLLFAKNYYRKVSRGKLNISYKVLPDVITVSKYMRDYSPGYNSSDFSPMANFSQEVWLAADQLYPSIDFGNYDLFIIFHAGVSAGIDLGTFTIDRNMPSVYLSQKTFKNIFGENFAGFPVDNGNSFINNSIIMPETESREFTDIEDNTYLNQFSINGLLVNNIAGFLGLPDLFNTETGRSAIGRFGLMDSQGMNAGYGIFPPEPSPWSKIILGWENPVSISSADQKVFIAARSTASISDTTIVKIPINSTEYFLIENRAQDAFKNFVNITYKRSGQIFTKTIRPDTSGYYYILPDSIPGGVVIDVDEFDASVPGNGIVVWHIDEKIINDNFASNKINAGDIKGVSVVEADGINDIGQIFYSVLGSVIGEGDSEDFWYKGNKAQLYKNRFDADSKPNSNSNYGAKSLITLENFSLPGNKMSFDLKWGGQGFKLLAKTKTAWGSNKKILTSSDSFGSNQVLLLENSNLYIYNLQGGLILQAENFSDIRPITLGDNFTNYIIGAKGNTINFFSSGSNGEEIKTIICPGEVTALSASVNQSAANILIGVWDSKSYAFQIPLSELYKLNSLQKGTFQIYEGDDKLKSFAVDNASVFILGEESLIDINAIPQAIQFGAKTIQAVTSKNNLGGYVSVVLLEDNRFAVYESGMDLFYFSVNAESNINTFSVIDISNDGNNYIVFPNDDKIFAYNLNGVLAEKYPIELPNKEKVISIPLIADLNDDSSADIIVFTENGNIYSFDAVTTRIQNSFPLSTGSKISTSPVLIKNPLPNSGPLPAYRPLISLITESNDLYVWQTGNKMGKSYWLGETGNSLNSNFVEYEVVNEIKKDFFPADKAYNWPNPVYGNETYIRFYVSDNANANIKIFDLAGELVDELNDRAVGGFDNEIVWNVANIQSGIYYARIEVVGDGGNSSSKIIKIAVIK